MSADEKAPSPPRPPRPSIVPADKPVSVRPPPSSTSPSPTATPTTGSPSSANVPSATMVTVIGRRAGDAAPPASTGSAPNAPTIGETEPRQPNDLDAQVSIEVTSSPALVDARPQTISGADRYTSVGTLGSGGMGDVFACVDNRIGRQVAMKTLRAELSAKIGSGTAAARFIREVRVQGQLEHPSIVPVYDVGITDDGRAYFTMKRVRGTTLRAVLKRRVEAPTDPTTMPLRRLLGLFDQALQAIAYAHARGVVHRDIKPDNLMFGSFGEVYVLDWGVAKTGGTATEEGETGGDTDPIVTASDSDQLTQVGIVIGTPGYMAPEQARGEAIDARADVYALGAILFEMLAMEPLHTVRGAKAKLESAVKGVDGHPRRRKPDADIPPELDAICARATSLDPSVRFNDAGEMHAALERFLNDERDVVLRQSIAEEHATAARTLAQAVLAKESDLDTRKRALAEAGRALALDPENEAARSVVAELFTAAPRELPEELETQLERQREALARQMIRNAAIGFSNSLIFIPFTLWMGIRDWNAFIGLYVSIILFVAFSVWCLRRPEMSPNIITAQVIASTFATGFSAVYFGPFILVPAWSALNAFALTLSLRKRREVHMLACMLAILVPLALQLAGITEPFFSIEREAITILPTMAWFRPTPTLLVLAGSAVAVVVISVQTIGRFQALLDNTQRELLINRWQMSQLVPRAPNLSVRPPKDGAKETSP